ncbi:MAG: DedA family protein [Deltaproteobacteria bacterium]|nr:DedA family protein [Deltaproteobacteria bacterium]
MTHSTAGTDSRTLKRLYDWTIRSAATRRAVWALAGVCFLQSLFLPVPPDLLLIPMVLARRARAWTFAGISTLSSTAGGVAGYAIGYFLFETVGEPLLALWGYEGKLEAFETYRREWGAWIVVAGALTPLPYKLVAVACGAARLDLGVFVLASLLSRGFRFYVEATLLWYFGPPVRTLIERHLSAATVIGLVLVVGVWLLLRYIA